MKKKCRCPLSNIGNSLCIWDSPYWYDKLKEKKTHIFCRKLDQKIWNSNAKFDGQKDIRTVWWNDWKLIDLDILDLTFIRVSWDLWFQTYCTLILHLDVLFTSWKLADTVFSLFYIEQKYEVASKSQLKKITKLFVRDQHKKADIAAREVSSEVN